MNCELQIANQHNYIACRWKIIIIAKYANVLIMIRLVEAPVCSSLDLMIYK